MSDAHGVHALVAVSPPEDCPAGRVAARHDVRAFAPAGTATRPQVVLADADAADVAGAPAATPVVKTGDSVVCRLRTGDGGGGGGGECACSRDRCLAADGDDWLPLRPYAWAFHDDRLRLWLAARSADRVESTLEALASAGFDPSLERLGGDVPGGAADVRRVDVSVLTDRQREVAELAVRHGYYAADGASAAELAAELDISPATLSEHLRAVISKLGPQLFGGEAADRTA